MRRLIIYMLLIFIMVGLCGCGRFGRSAKNPDYQTVTAEPNRDTQAAREYNAKGLQAIEQGDQEKAEQQLKAACLADVFFGPAHNNLGNLYFHQEKYYLSAWEFQYAAKLMPHRIEPKNNLGMVLEKVGKLDEAAQHYEQALELQPDNPEIIGNLARLYIRQNRKDQRTRDLLQAIILKDTRPEWATWAKEKITIMPKEAN